METVEITITYDGPANNLGQMTDLDGTAVLNPRKVKYQADGNPEYLVKQCHKVLYDNEYDNELVRVDTREETPWLVMIAIFNRVRYFEWCVSAARVLCVSRSMKYDEVLAKVEQVASELGTTDDG